MSTSKVYVDLQNADPEGRVRLNCVGTIQDLNRQGIRLQEGLQLAFYCEDLEVDGEVTFSPEERGWVARIDWTAIRARSAS
jgi:hypothetical protein